MTTPNICACCGMDLRNSSIEYASQLFNPLGPSFFLCEMCGEDEEDAVEKAGTNVIPSLVEKYRKRYQSN